MVLPAGACQPALDETCLTHTACSEGPSYMQASVGTWAGGRHLARAGDRFVRGRPGVLLQALRAVLDLLAHAPRGRHSLLRNFLRHLLHVAGHLVRRLRGLLLHLAPAARDFGPWASMVAFDQYQSVLQACICICSI